MMGFWDRGGISWTICKQSALHSRQIIAPTPHHSIFTGRMLFLTLSRQCQSTEGSSCYTIIVIVVFSKVAEVWWLVRLTVV